MMDQLTRLQKEYELAHLLGEDQEYIQQLEDRIRQLGGIPGEGA